MKWPNASLVTGALLISSCLNRGADPSAAGRDSVGGESGAHGDAGGGGGDSGSSSDAGEGDSGSSSDAGEGHGGSTGGGDSGSSSDAGEGHGSSTDGGAASQCDEYRYVALDFPTPGTQASDLALGPDENIWVAERGEDRVARVEADGTITEFTGLGGTPYALTAGPDGNLWVTIEEPQAAIIRFSPEGEITGTFELSSSLDAVEDITTGPDGNLWFTNLGRGRVGRITVDGDITEFPVPGAPDIESEPSHIATGPDGNLWFTLPVGDRIGRITTEGDITLFDLPLEIASSGGPEDIAPGPDGQLLFRSGPLLGWITTDGTADSLAPSAGVEWSIMTPLTDPDGNIWFAWGSGIGRITPEGVTSYFDPLNVAAPIKIAFGADGRLWFLDLGKVGWLEPCSGNEL